MSKEPNIDFSEEEREIARRRDEIIRRMANTPPQPKPKLAANATAKKRRGAVKRDVPD
jgi:hypothetical protein